MSKFRRIVLLTLTFSLSALACSLPGIAAAPDADAIGAFIAGTLTAASGLTEAAGIPGSPGLQTPPLTFTPAPPTPTPTITLTVTPFFTSTPLIPRISVSVATNCRSGPGKVYNMQGALLVGETAQALARDPTGMYWYISNPDAAGKFCWVWGEYATLTGNSSALPIYTPPPTPTFTPTPTPAPDFEAGFANLETCPGAWWVDISINNTGSFAFKSLGLTVKDKATDVVLTSYTDGFVNRDGCLAVTTKDVIEPGNSFVVSSSSFAYNPDDHNLRATVLLCMNTGQAGTCVSRVINFKP